jgi:hypothetical protein
MTVRSSAGTTIGISSSAPATFNVAGYTALTFTTIGEVTDLGEFGREFNLITHNPLGSRGTVKLKGSFNEGAITMQLGLDTDDAGQVLAKTASLADADYSFKVTTQNSDDYYFQAKVMSFKVSVGSVDSVTGATITLELTTNSAGVGIVEDLAV